MSSASWENSPAGSDRSGSGTKGSEGSSSKWIDVGGNANNSGSSSPSFNFSRSTDPSSSTKSGSAPRDRVDGHNIGTSDPSRALRSRDKGIICENYFHHRRCPIGNCPLAHVYDGEIRPLPQETCMFFNRGKKLRPSPTNKGGCLRDTCKFFHGSRQQLRELKAANVAVYKPQDYMHLGSPWQFNDPTDPSTTATAPVHATSDEVNDMMDLINVLNHHQQQDQQRGDTAHEVQPLCPPPALLPPSELASGPEAHTTKKK